VPDVSEPFSVQPVNSIKKNAAARTHKRIPDFIDSWSSSLGDKPAAFNFAFFSETVPKEKAHQPFKNIMCAAAHSGP